MTFTMDLPQEIRLAMMEASRKAQARPWWRKLLDLFLEA